MLNCKNSKSLTAGLVSAALFAATGSAHAATYVFDNIPNGVTHVKGYTGTGGPLEISVGIDASSMFASQMVTSVQNAVNTWNGLTPTIGNLQTGLIAANAFDFESVLLHEMGHTLGLGHPNLGSEAGGSPSDNDFASASKGANNMFDLDAGADGVIGSADDIRGDDVNSNLFRVADNDPFATDLGIVDSTTYSRDLNLLPAGDTFAAIGSSAVADALGYSSTEAVMVQGTLGGETQRTLAADDVAGILYAQAGLDELAGTADDYTFTLNFVGATRYADILIGFDDNRTGFATSFSTGSYLSGNHTAIAGSTISFNTGFNWAFNDVANNAVSAVPLPGSMWAMMVGFAGLGGVGMRRKSRT